MENNIFLQFSILLGLTISIAFIIRLLKQPLLVAYILAGIISGPIFLNILSGDHEMFEAFSQFGIVLLLFVLGLNLNLNHLKKIGKVAAITGLGQVLFTFIFGVLILHFLNFPFYAGLYLALAITFSSTIIIVKLLNDKKDTESIYGKYTIGLMLIQDIIAIVILILLGNFTNDGDLLTSLMLFLLKGLAIVIVLFFVSKYFLHRILDRVASSGEFLFIFTIAWCFGVASLVYLIGFSIEIGAVVAGLTLGSSPYQAGIAGRVKPLRDFFIVLFFIILGSQMGMSDVGGILVPGIILSLFILIGNPLILYVLFRFFQIYQKKQFFGRYNGCSSERIRLHSSLHRSKAWIRG
jgi:Kef-type K+ transport system membrane component KefB